MHCKDPSVQLRKAGGGRKDSSGGLCCEANTEIKHFMLSYMLCHRMANLALVQSLMVTIHSDGQLFTSHTL